MIWISKGRRHILSRMDGNIVSGINSYLFPHPEELEAVRLSANQGRCFRGCDIYGAGFLFADEDDPAFAGTLRDAELLIEKDRRNAEVIFPYIGGKELTSHPIPKHDRYAINFANLPIEDARRWPDVFALVEAKVRPVRAKLGGYSVAERRKEVWWQYGTYTPALYEAIAGSSEVLTISRATTYVCFEFLNPRMVFSDRLLVIHVTHSHREFCCMQSRLHETWSLMFGSTHGVGGAAFYSPITCFETFPFPESMATSCDLEVSGQRYRKFRTEMMIARDEGLTKTYNRFHDPAERAPDIQCLRELHHAMDVAVLRAYGWDDLADRAAPEYLTEANEPDHRYQGRLFWLAGFRDEVLARLLDLNRARAEEERRLGLSPRGASLEPEVEKGGHSLGMRLKLFQEMH